MKRLLIQKGRRPLFLFADQPRALYSLGTARMMHATQPQK